jgi:hypothetical protein
MSWLAFNFNESSSTPIINKYGESGSIIDSLFLEKKQIDMRPLFITQLLAFE